ncbi:hypothetical protein CIW49_31165 [Mycolicibacterium sp. P1-18]|uniref:Rv1733c family protein n=1 Tax=Mycolicibacterium sp. P1-18 TaxID=2024615 RepID=UPI0011F2F529|nr:hypothetical protein [Mycolicibacterium sp. P1-18]KAA0090862.1 hypothetical protein CIW49_31165 [Mycolicibacterium sp. P1-18]
MSVQSFARYVRWNVRALKRNPLTRTSDRLEALTFVALFVMTLLAIPVSMNVADRAYDSTMQFVHEESQTRHSVQAEAVTSTATPTDFGTPLYVDVKWTEGGRDRTERIASAGAVAAGAKLTVWLDDSGKVVTAPLRPADASVNATSAGWSVWLLAVVLCGLVGLVVRKALDRSRARSWDRALQLFAYGDDGWANRRS